MRLKCVAQLLSGRQFGDGSGKLIRYERPDPEGPKLSDFATTRIAKDKIQELTESLQKPNVIVGIVKKTRRLYIFEQARVSVDSVDSLGDFIVIKGILFDDQSVEDGQKIADRLMAELGVDKADVITGTYFDIIKGDNELTP